MIDLSIHDMKLWFKAEELKMATTSDLRTNYNNLAETRMWTVFAAAS